MSNKTETPATGIVAAELEHNDNHEIEAEINARMIALRQSDSHAIAHLENILGAILQTMDNQGLTAFRSVLSEIEILTPEEKEILQVYGEVATDENPGKIIKSKRQIWREEIIELEKQLHNEFTS